MVDALKRRAVEHGNSAEEEHRQILREALLGPEKKSFAQVLATIPNVGNDEDFERVDDSKGDDVFG